MCNANLTTLEKELAETLNCLTKSRKPFLNKLFVQKNDYSPRKTSGHLHFLFDENSGNTHRIPANFFLSGSRNIRTKKFFSKVYAFPQINPFYN